MSKEPVDVVDQSVAVSDQNSDKQPKTKRKGCFSRTAKIFVLLFLIVAVWVIGSLQGVPLQISPETTFVTEPRTANGKWIDYFAAFEQKYYPAEMKTDDNGFRLIARNLGVTVNGEYYRNSSDNQEPSQTEKDTKTETLRRQVYEKLGLDPNTKPTLTYQSPHTFLANYAKKQFPDEENNQKADEFPRKITAIWTLDDLPMMQEWLEQNNPALDVIVEAVSKPVFRTPLTRFENVRIPATQSMYLSSILEQMQPFRDYARALQARFNYRLGTGDIDGAIQDKIALHRLGRHVTNQGILINSLVGIAIEGVATNSGIAGNLNVQPTEEQIRRLIQLTNELPEKPTLKKIIESERYFVFGNLQLKVMVDDTEKAMSWLPFMMSIGNDWNIVFRRFNRYFDDFLDGKLEQQSFSVSPQKSFFHLNYWFMSRKTRSETFADVLFKLMFDSLEGTQNAVNRKECADHLQKITTAMLLYHAEHGELPPTYTTNANGEPLQSWRVLLLQYLGEEELYKQIRLDEAWDSEFNRQFHEKMPTVYACPSLKHKTKSNETKFDETKSGEINSETNYTVIVGNETPFDRSGKGKKLSGFGSESVDLVLVTETKMSGCWMNPNFDVSFEDAQQGINGKPDAPKTIGSEHAGGCNNGLRSGSVTFFSENIEQPLWENILKGMERMK
ncbi:MAG: DUF1559 domain-containing protein [Planctomycetaceae bacterium]|jgi:hypothetical protein|nr:DUF1559 domain-containing protein [Planctomycetaceae bacterium]